MTLSAQFKQIKTQVVPATPRQRLAALFLKSLPVKHFTSDKQDVDKSVDPKKIKCLPVDHELLLFISGDDIQVVKIGSTDSTPLFQHPDRFNGFNGFRI